ncbi:MAG TPA: YdeI/OmpD-associated family protein [Candidatus Polarisedimenticolaceae bacterium]|nr:YdeI/OmpD-associated family protein [Candidatus Polarisedimenticolaceae bacterium]
MSEPRTFGSAQEFRRWLARNHARVEALEVRCFKVSEAERGLTYKQAVDEALCHGWIDGARHAVDESSFRVRFTPRKRKSTWSRVNLARVEELIATGRMTAPGLAAYRGRDEKRTGLYSFERAAMELAPPYLRRLRASEDAWRFYKNQAPWYQRVTAFYVMSAKREETRDRRFTKLLACSAAGKRMGILERAGRSKGRG